MQDTYQDYFQGNLVGFDPRTEAYRRRTSRFQEMASGDAPTDETLTTLNRLTGGIAHGFNDLLTAINGNCSLALRTLEEGHPARRYILEIQEAGEKAADFTRQLLAYDAPYGYGSQRGEKASAPA